MNKNIAFIGHRYLVNKEIVSQRLQQTIQNEINSGYSFFTMGTHGDFDNIALSSCRKLRNIYPNIEIEVVLTSLCTLKPLYKTRIDITAPYCDVKTILYEIEEEHYKRRITKSNQLMLDNCGTLICYVDDTRKQSGAKTALKYAKLKGLRIINLYKETDNPLYGLSDTEKNILWEQYLQN